MIPRPLPLLRSAAFGAALASLALNAVASRAQDAVPASIEAVSPRVLFVVSGGYWEGDIAPLRPEIAAAEPAASLDAPEPAGADAAATATDPPSSADAPKPADTASADAAKPAEASPAQASAAPVAVARGFYRLVILRSDDNSSRVHLQRFALSPDGPKLVDGRELEEISSLPAYVTDARSEDTSSVSNQPGFAVFITLKTDPSIVERETWTVFIDEFGEVEVNRATN